MSNFITDRKKSWFAIIALFLMSFPWDERINSIFFSLLILHFLIDKNFIKKISAIKQNIKILLPYLIFYTFHFVFLYQSGITENAQHTIIVKTSLLILPILFVCENYIDIYKKRLWFLFIISCIVSFMYAIAHYIVINKAKYGWDGFTNRMFFSEGVMHPGYYANFMLVAIFFTFYLFKTNITIFQKRVLYISMTVLFFTQYILLSKTCLIVLILYTIWILFHYLKKRIAAKYLYVVFSISVLFFLFVLTKIPSISERIKESTEAILHTDKTVTLSQSTGSRIVAWQNAWYAIKASPWWGYGTGNADDVLNETLIANGYTTLASYEMHTHNQFLHTWLELGIFSIFLLILIFFGWLFFFYKEKNTVALWTTLLFALNCLTDDAMMIQAIIVFFVLVICMERFAMEKSR